MNLTKESSLHDAKCRKVLNFVDSKQCIIGLIYGPKQCYSLQGYKFMNLHKIIIYKKKQTNIKLNNNDVFAPIAWKLDLTKTVKLSMLVTHLDSSNFLLVVPII